ncbi:MAG: hypothetical protein ACRCZE_00455 [Candidatus Altimarinota bacterium]
MAPDKLPQDPTDNLDYQAEAKTYGFENEINPEIKRLEELKKSREEVLGKSRESLNLLKEDQSLRWRNVRSEIDLKTDPQNDDAQIPDYEGWSWVGEDENVENPVRHTLNGYLYANNIFFGGGSEGRVASDKVFAKAVELYDNSDDGITNLDSYFSQKHLDSDLGLKGYLGEASEFSKFDSVKGAIAGLLKLADENIGKKDEHKKYSDYLRSEFKKLSGKEYQKSEEKQLELLFKIKSPFEVIGRRNDWRIAFGKMEDLTDPTKDDALIDDYPGTGKDDADNSTRHNLSGYMYGAYLFNGGDRDGQKAADSVMDEAHKLFKNSDEGLFNAGTAFEDSHLKDNMGLGPYLKQAADYTNSEKVKGAIAGLLKYTEEMSEDESAEKSKKQFYNKYLHEQLDLISPEMDESAQFGILSGILSPDQLIKENTEKEAITLADQFLSLYQQHPDFKFNNKDILAFIENKVGEQTADEQLEFQEKLKVAANTEVMVFTHLRTTKHMVDLPSLFHQIKATNLQLKPKYLSDEEIQSLEDQNKALIDRFAKNFAISPIKPLEKRIEDRDLESLYNLEQESFQQLNLLSERLTEVNEIKAGKRKVEVNPATAAAVIPELLDPYESGWANAEDVSSNLGNFTGTLEVRSSSETETVKARTHEGKIFGSGLISGTEVTRTEEDAKIPAKKVENNIFVLVTYKGEKIWISEDYLFEKSASTPDLPSTPAPTEDPKSAQKIENPRQGFYGPSNMDITFNRLQSELETNPSGSSFDLFFNEAILPCRVSRQADGYHLDYGNNDVGQGKLPTFPNLQVLRDYIENGSFYQMLTFNLLKSKTVWERAGVKGFIDEALELKVTGPNKLYVELDWHRNQPFETGNAKVKLEVMKKGTIHYHIDKEYVGPNSENTRDGYAANFKQLVEQLHHAKDWSEKYEDNEDKEDFNAISNREKLMTDIADGRFYTQAAGIIGQHYDFNSWVNRGFATMRLNWDKSTANSDKQRSYYNPEFSVRLNPDNSYSFKLLNSTGPQNARVAYIGRANSLNEVFSKTAEIKAAPQNYLKTDQANLTI